MLRSVSTNCCTSFWRSSLRTCISAKSSIRLDSCLRAIACNRKIFSIKYIYKKTTNRKIYVIKKSYHLLRELPVCVVIQLWTHWFQLSILDCYHRVKCTDITCWFYSTHTTSKMYSSLKSFHTAMSFQLVSSLSFVYFLAFYWTSYQKSPNLYGTNELYVSK